MRTKAVARCLLVTLASLCACSGSPEARPSASASASPSASATPTRSPPLDDVPPLLVVPRGSVGVRGRVVDEAGAPIAGAAVSVSTEASHDYPDVLTDANGAFTTVVRATPALRLAASHPDYGLQWTDMEWRAWSRYDAISPEPVQLTLRRGVVLRGRLVDHTAQPRAAETLLLIPSYIGSGPHTLDATTDADGQFVFPRAVLNQFELIPRSLDEWHPETRQRAGEFLRIAQHPVEWAARAEAFESIEVATAPLTLVTVTFAITSATGAPLPHTDIDLWLRSGPTDYVGTVPRTDTQGRCRALMEPGIAYEVWASRDHAAREAPWSQSIPSGWHGSVEAPSLLTLVAR